MSVFGRYSRYYDLLYRDKNYSAECDYADELIHKLPTASSILDLACGTGRHAKLLAEKGYRVHGVDISEEMLKIAKKWESGNKLVFTHGDIRNVRLGKTFDVVLSLFHGMSYQTTNEDIINAFYTAHEHLNADGLFIFNCWYGPGVLTNKPTSRIKCVEDEDIKLIRFTEPVMHANENVVEVIFHLFVYNKQGGNVEEFKETHNMRYLFKPEVELMLNHSGFKLEGYFEFLTDKMPDFRTWNCCFVGKKG